MQHFITGRFLKACGRTRRTRTAHRINSAVSCEIEQFEARVLLSAGSLLWAPPADLRDAEDDYFSDVAIQADGKIIAVGTSHRPGGDDDFLVARYTAAGRLDAGFLGIGWTTLDFGGNDDAIAVAVQQDGKLVIGGTTDLDFGLLRLNSDGSLDASFGTDGKVAVDFGAADSLESLALSSDGKIVAAGRYEDVGGSVFQGAIVKLLSNGEADMSFSGDGKLLMATNFVSIAIDAADRIVAADLNATVSRINTDGLLDDDFGTSGTQTITFDLGANHRLSEVTLDDLGRSIVVGSSTDGAFTVGGVARLLPADGSFDNSFDGNGRASFDIAANASDSFLDVVALPNGSLVVSGLVAVDASEQYSSVIVLTPAGSLDSAFGDSGKFFYDTAATSFPGGLAVTKDGNYVLAGRLAPSGGDLEPFIIGISGRFTRRDDIAGRTKAGGWWVAESGGTSFINRPFGTWGTSHTWKYVASADFDGDGEDDFAGRDSNGDWWIALNSGSAFPLVLARHWNEAAGWRDEHFADFNGDGKFDVTARSAGGQWWLMLSTGTGFTTPGIWAGWSATAGWKDVVVADFTGDGRADIAGRTASGAWWVSTNTAIGTLTQRWGAWTESEGWNDVQSGDFNGDGLADIAGRNSLGQWRITLSTGTAFSSSVWTAWNPAAGWHNIVFGDFDGDGRTDVAGRTAMGRVWVARSDGGAFTNGAWSIWDESLGWHDVRSGDFNGDGKDDLAGRTSSGQWRVALSSGVAFEADAAWGAWNEAAGWSAYLDEFLLS
jgi:uncharacterized delta-60 repeat protein